MHMTGYIFAAIAILAARALAAGEPAAASGGEYPSPPPREQWKFMGDLAKREPVRTRWTRGANGGGLDISGGLRIADEYGIGENLETAISELKSFFADAGLPENGKVPLKLSRGKVAGRESYKLSVGKSGAELAAEDDEGMRRGIYYLENLMASQDGAFLPLVETERKPWLKNRISRCFFGPIKRPPFNRDELLDGVDYYPGDYLGKLAREGINGLWITVEFRDLAETSFAKRGPMAQRRLEKLRKTVEKCGRYGIKVWLFAIEPASLPAGDPAARRPPRMEGRARVEKRLRILHFKRIRPAVFARIPRRHIRAGSQSRRTDKHKPRREDNKLPQRPARRLRRAGKLPALLETPEVENPRRRCARHGGRHEKIQPRSRAHNLAIPAAARGGNARRGCST